jgi:hypothetical protein
MSLICFIFLIGLVSGRRDAPVVSSSLEEQNRHKILMKSPWEILQSPVGSGGVISLLSSHNIPDNLSEIGVEYIEVRHSLYCSDCVL